MSNTFGPVVDFSENIWRGTEMYLRNQQLQQDRLDRKENQAFAWNQKVLDNYFDTQLNTDGLSQNTMKAISDELGSLRTDAMNTVHQATSAGNMLSIGTLEALEKPENRAKLRTYIGADQRQKEAFGQYKIMQSQMTADDKKLYNLEAMGNVMATASQNMDPTMIDWQRIMDLDNYTNWDVKLQREMESFGTETKVAFDQALETENGLKRHQVDNITHDGLMMIGPGDAQGGGAGVVIDNSGNYIAMLDKKTAKTLSKKSKAVSHFMDQPPYNEIEDITDRVAAIMQDLNYNAFINVESTIKTYKEGSGININLSDREKEQGVTTSLNDAIASYLANPEWTLGMFEGMTDDGNSVFQQAEQLEDGKIRLVPSKPIKYQGNNVYVAGEEILIDPYTPEGQGKMTSLMRYVKKFIPTKAGQYTLAPALEGDGEWGTGSLD